MSDLEPMDPEVARLLRAEDVPEPTRDAHARVLARLGMAIPALGAPSHVGTAPTGGGGVAGWRLAATVAGAFVSGAVVGGVVTGLREPPKARVVYVEHAQSAAPAASASSAPSQTAVSPPSAPPPPRPPLPVRAVPTAGAGELARERLLLEDARARLAAGDANGALVRLHEHETQFPSGSLDEEREALAVQALVNAARYDEARARASAFRKRSPNSVFLPAIDVTLQSIP